MANNLESKLNKWGQTERMFALIIGIDDYDHTSRLTGAVKDALEIEKFLKSKTGGLGVDPRRIQVLRNTEDDPKATTRPRIVAAFTALKDNKHIRENDPILIYYAGHGTEMESEEQGRMKQCIVPHDAYPKKTPTSRRRILPIPDSTIRSWLNDLSEKKGNNITVIFDCCHSTSSTRYPETGVLRGVEGVPRGVEFEGVLPSDIDIPSSRGDTVPMAFETRDCRSHVLLAACGAEEKAREWHKRGLFTTALLKKLKAPHADKLSYEEFMEDFPSLKIDQQNPQCEGHHKNRILFSMEIAEERPSFFRVIRQDDGLYSIAKASKIYGITVGSVFYVYEKEDPRYKPLGALCVDGFGKGHARTTLKTPEPLPTPAYACQVGLAPGQKLSVYFDGDPGDAASQCRGYIVRKERKEDAKLIVHLRKNRADFTTNRRDITQHGYVKLRGVERESLSSFLSEASKWDMHLDNCQPNQWNGQVKLEFFLLEPDEDKVDEEGNMVFKPKRNAIPENIIPGRAIRNPIAPHYVLPDKDFKGLNPEKDCIIPDRGVIDLIVRPDDLYGIKIWNNTGINLYPYLFRFGISEQTIRCDFKPPVSGPDATPDAPLRARSFLTIGYGTSGAVPLGYKLPKNTDIDVGFLKLYLSTTPADIRLLEQSLSNRTDDRDVAKRIKVESWSTITCTVVQRCPPKST